MCSVCLCSSENKQFVEIFVSYNMLFRIFILFIALQPLFTFSQQADEVLYKFFAVRQGETVYMRWTITAGNTCEDTYIERSADGIYYERIGLIGGICGNPNQAVTYEFTDTLPLINQLAYYRLELGFYGYSSAREVEFTRFNEDGFLLAPNPFSDFTRLAFENDEENEHELIISDMQGRTVQKMTSMGSEFIILRLDMNSGVYFFRIANSDQVLYKGKLVVK